MNQSAMQWDSNRKTVTIERDVHGSVDDVWELWTTKAGLESWWGPDGFQMTVVNLDLRPGGEWLYVMTAVAPEQIEFMRRGNMPLSTEAKVTYTETSRPRRLAYKLMADFVPGVAPYEVATAVDLHPGKHGTKVIVSFDAMHDEAWTARARAGHESQLNKLDRLLTGRRHGASG